MSIRASVGKLQTTGVKLYQSMAQYFGQNALVRDTWMAMAQDIEQLIRGTGTLPRAFWRQLKTEEKQITDAGHPVISVKAIDKAEDKSLHKCLIQALDFEEPMILRVYGPVIRQLRIRWTQSSLDFFVMVKAHITRLTRVVRSFSGDPVLADRSVTLMALFEKEIQVQEPAAAAPAKASRKAAARRRSSASPKKQRIGRSKRKKTTAVKARPLHKHAKKAPKRSKRLIKKIAIRRRRRAQR